MITYHAKLYEKQINISLWISQNYIYHDAMSCNSILMLTNEHRMFKVSQQTKDSFLENIREMTIYNAK